MSLPPLEKMQLYQMLHQRKLDFYLVNSAVEAQFDHARAVERERTLSALPPLLAGPHRDIPVTPRALKEGYQYSTNSGSVDSFGAAEKTVRHPEPEDGTDDSDSDGGDSDEDAHGCDGGRARRQRGPFAPITTLAAAGVYAIAFAGPEQRALLQAAYALQLSVRIDCAGSGAARDSAEPALVYDCYSHKPARACPDVNQDDAPLPILRDYLRCERSLNVVGFMLSGGRAEPLSDDDDPKMDRPLELNSNAEEGQPGAEKRALNRLSAWHQAALGAAMYARLMRVRVPLSAVVGLRLVTLDGAAADAGDASACDGLAVLVLQLDRPPSRTDGFFARRIVALNPSYMEFNRVADWTPGEAASAATRHHVIGSLAEMRNLAAHLGAISPAIARMLRADGEDGPPPGSNALAPRGEPPPSLALEDAPPFPPPPLLDAPPPTGGAAAAAPGTAHAAAPAGAAMSEEEVCALLVSQGLVRDEGRAREASACVKRAIALGHLDVSDATADTIIYDGHCFSCGAWLECTLGRALAQPGSGSRDYDENDRRAAVRGCCVGNWLTGLCVGRPQYVSGRQHHHCGPCGACVGDCDSPHCARCGRHFYSGPLGGGCRRCEQRAVLRGPPRKQLANLPPPTADAWDGRIPGAAERASGRHGAPNPVPCLYYGVLGSESGETSMYLDWKHGFLPGSAPLPAASAAAAGAPPRPA